MGTSSHRRILAALVILVASVRYSTAEWQVIKSVDALDTASTSTYAVNYSKQPIQQFGHDVRVALFVSCAKLPELGPSYSHRDIKRLITTLNFTETVAIGERMIRWRIDENQVDYRTDQFYRDGKSYYLSRLIDLGHDKILMEQLRNAKIMRVEADLPWAGKVIIEFDVSGGAAAFKQIPCENNTKRPKSR